MIVSSITALTRKLKPFDVLLLSADDPRFSWIKYQFLNYNEDWSTTIAVRPEVYEILEKQTKA